MYVYKDEHIHLRYSITSDHNPKLSACGKKNISDVNRRRRQRRLRRYVEVCFCPARSCKMFLMGIVILRHQTAVTATTAAAAAATYFTRGCPTHEAIHCCAIACCPSTPATWRLLRYSTSATDAIAVRYGRWCASGSINGCVPFRCLCTRIPERWLVHKTHTHTHTFGCVLFELSLPKVWRQSEVTCVCVCVRSFVFVIG